MVHNYNQYDIDKYGRFNSPKHRGDGIEGHELIQNAWLKNMDMFMIEELDYQIRILR